MVSERVFGIVEDSEVLVQVGIADGIGNVELSNLFLANSDGLGKILFEGDSLSYADKDGCLFVINSCQNDLAVHVIDLHFCYFLGDMQLLECKIVLELSVENFHLLDADFHVVRMIHEDIVVLFRVHLHQGVL